MKVTCAYPFCDAAAARRDTVKDDVKGTGNLRAGYAGVGRTLEGTGCRPAKER